ncbi:MAG: PD-(D/E)XK nuclease family protein [Gammaproteobacteria bacterium]|nr:PD-(D/E)XK nuclease family protein [Gammaproteobacteria bacterium]
MDFKRIDPQQTLIVTASRRQARYIREQYQQSQIAQGKEVWHSLNVMPWSAFLDKCWSYLNQAKPQPRTRLNKEQSMLLWQQLVLDSKHTESLLNAQQAVNLSYDAWRMMNQWQIEDFSFQHGDRDQEAFAEWYFDYRKLLQKNQWLDLHQVASLIAQNIQEIAANLPAQLGFYGFQQINPQQEAIIKRLTELKERINLTSVNGHSSIKKIVVADSAEQEFIVAIRWAIQRLQQEPQQSVAIIVPELQQQRAKIERLIQKECYPEEFLKGEKANYWHDISIAENLDKEPMIQVLMTCLQLLDKSVNKSQLQSLLLSPYLYQTQEAYWLATKLELDVRKSNKNYYNLSAIKDLCFKHQTEFAWVTQLEAFKDELTSPKSFNDFIKQLLSLLERLHWSGYESLNSREFQLQQQFLEAIKAASKLHRVLDKSINWSSSLTVLQKYLQTQSFHQESPQAPIKIMGMLEAVAIEYDAIWMLSATDKILPQKTSINPFLAKALQLKHELPGSSHQREIEYAQNILDALYAEQELVFSYASHDGEQEQLLSPLLNSLADEVGIEPIQLKSDQPPFIQNWPHSQLEEYYDNQGLPLNSDGYAAGGSGLLKAQAASPFDAYLRYRLNLAPLETDDLGISFMDRGNIFHKVMQLIWQHLRTQQALLSYSHDELETLVDRSIITTLNIESKHLYLLNIPQFFDTEKVRLQSLVMAALEFDKERVPFEVIATEAKREIEVGGLRLHITIDRIDQLADGSLIIIDYKTGVPRLVDLLNDPIGEPQLLLYAVSEHKAESPVAGILFYQAHLKANKYIGFTEDTEMIQGVKALKELANNPYPEQFAEAIIQWRAMLNQIAESFKAGDAAITDYSGNYTDHYPVSRWLERDINYQSSLSVAIKEQQND